MHTVVFGLQSDLQLARFVSDSWASCTSLQLVYMMMQKGDLYVKLCSFYMKHYLLFSVQYCFTEFVQTLLKFGCKQHTSLTLDEETI